MPGVLKSAEDQATLGGLNHQGQASDDTDSSKIHQPNVPGLDQSIPLSNGQFRCVCALRTHDTSSSTADILVNSEIYPPGAVGKSDVLQMVPIKGGLREHLPNEALLNRAKASTKVPNQADQYEIDSSKSYYFQLRQKGQEVSTRQHHPEISIASHIASNFNLLKCSRVMVSSIEDEKSCASHVEIVFRDQYLARADMWRLVNSELVGKCVYKGQKLTFMDSIKAMVKSVFIRGRKVQSAFFNNATKPIFRSESARYVLFIQMSKEMWDFDSEGTGEIMFDKVINGFLPDLFRRWQQAQVKHLISIVLFTRMMYEMRLPPGPKANEASAELQSSHTSVYFRDFYRVVVSDTISGASADILTQLKSEFKVFKRDICIQKPQPGDFNPLGSGFADASTGLPEDVIAGIPSDAAHGNVLEAINLASSQFSTDYIDRDLVRTGVSVVVISAGAGLFEVDYDLLTSTTDNLIENGVGIDLVCLSRMPLHSVPLFQYLRPQNSRARLGGTHAQLTSGHTSHSGSPYFQSSSISYQSSFSPGSFLNDTSAKSQFNYGIPHWIDISFWAPSDAVTDVSVRKDARASGKTNFLSPNQKTFVPRIRLYEIQMMGVTESTGKEVLVPSLNLPHVPLKIPNLQSYTIHTKDRNRFKHSGLDSVDIDDDAGVFTRSLKSNSPAHMKFQGTEDNRSQLMKNHDELLFRHPRTSLKDKSRRRPRQRHFKEGPLSRRLESSMHKKTPLSIDHSTTPTANMDSEYEEEHKSQRTPKGRTPAYSDLARRHNTPQTSTASRSISFGLRGLAPSIKSAASAKIDNAQSSTWTTRQKDTSVTEESPITPDVSTRTVQDLLTPATPNARQSSDTESGITFSSDSEHPSSSKPIPIRKAAAMSETKISKEGKENRGIIRKAEPYDRVAALRDLSNREKAPQKENGHQQSTPPVSSALSPQTTLAPWLTILNPSNPSKTNASRTGRLGRWQHTFPRPPKTSQIKWKSLCSPAAVPLTTEDFPTAEQISEEYKESSYTVVLPESTRLDEKPRSLTLEILAFRLSRGFQIVVGNRVREARPEGLVKSDDVFNESILEEVGSSLFLSRGNSIHQLIRSGTDRFQVQIFSRHKTSPAEEDGDEGARSYSPSIRSMLADEYESRKISIAPERGTFNWDMIDSFIVGHECPHGAQYEETLRPWRARFVLIPVELPSGARRMMRSGEDNDEEIRLEGIRKLTQIWQRFRFVPADEYLFQPSNTKIKDPNPLDVTYQTKDPSAIVAAELENVLDGDENAGRVRLLPEPELYQRANLDLKKLAETIQGEKGVRMLDRRWHLRLHYSCFIGIEFTTWMLQNFRDIDTREEAEQLGNELMRKGLFRHVEQRHEFRDGNFFYQVESQYRNPRPQSRGWFGRGKTSIPLTPTSNVPPEPLKTTRSRSSSNADGTPEVNTMGQSERKPRPTVALSKSLLYNVDHRKRSYRPEVINLHYDRLHNPDNCYHVRIEWMNATPRLIQEAIVSWATSIERYGLRLVEVPIGEASSIASMHPFRSPYRIKLAASPPPQQPQPIFDATAFGSHLKIDPLFYQKAILRQYDFVLDYEAATSFPADVSVSYSWGKSDYRYSQYIHRSGTLIAQITNDGDFLILANRLCNNRNAASGVASSSLSVPDLPLSISTDPPHAQVPVRPSSNRSAVTNISTASNQSPRPSPFSSPAVRATLVVPQPVLVRNMPPNTAAASNSAPITSGGHHSRTSTIVRDAASFRLQPQPQCPSISPEDFTRDFHRFCTDAAALERFYNEVLSKSSTPSDSPSEVQVASGGRTPVRTPLRNVNLNPAISIDDDGVEVRVEGVAEAGETEAGIPKLDLPSRLVG